MSFLEHELSSIALVSRSPLPASARSYSLQSYSSGFHRGALSIAQAFIGWGRLSLMLRTYPNSTWASTVRSDAVARELLELWVRSGSVRPMQWSREEKMIEIVASALMWTIVATSGRSYATCRCCS
eukprot:3108674-Amphidinium_carterae.1